MKIALLHQNIPNQQAMTAGMALAGQKLAFAGINIIVDYYATSKKFSTVNYANNVNYFGVAINPYEILAEVKGSYDVACLIYDETKYTPQPTNPVHHGITVNNCSPIQIPLGWWMDRTKEPYEYFTEVLAQFFIHEIAHYLFYVNKKPDIVHDQFKYPEWQNKQPIDYYIHIIKDLKPPKEKPITPVKITALKKGSKGEEVKQLQRDLKALGYFKYPLITGTYGSVTETAVRAFQTATGLVSDGIAGKATLQKIEGLKKNPKIDFGLLPEVLLKANHLIARCKAIGYNIRITEGYRSQERQDELYAQGRTKKGKIVTNAKVSNHTSRKAFDICFVGKNPYPSDDKVWKTIADIAIQCGLKAGYYFKSFPDRVHFEV